MFDMEMDPPMAVFENNRIHRPARSRAKLMFHKLAKRFFDIAVSLVLLVPFILSALVLVALNPLLNRGGLFFVQDRMGRDCRPFRAWKFRSMVSASVMERGPFDPLENDRITKLGRILRKSRIDELPQIINVLRGDMSLIGPRPDALSHASVYLLEIPGYRDRHSVRPGISGYAQVMVGYVDGLDGINRKVAADHYYLRNASIRLDSWIAWRTIAVIVMRKGA